MRCERSTLPQTGANGGKPAKSEDEYSRFRYLEAFDEHSTYSSAVFPEHLIKKFPFKIECVQTDNGLEFTKRLSNTQNPTPTLFESRLEQYGIRHKLIKPCTPRRCVKDGKDLLSTAYNPFGEVLPKTPPIRRLNCAFAYLLDDDAADVTYPPKTALFRRTF